MNRATGRNLAAPVAAAAILRLALLAATLLRTGTSVITSGDTASYLEPGRNLLFRGQFFSGGLPEINRTPGYCLFLAIISLPGAAFAAFLQVLLSAFTVVLVWRLSRAVVDDDRVALLAAWLFAFEPVSIIYSVRLLAETLFVALLLLSLERIAVFLSDRNLRHLATGGLWLAAATFVRPASYYLPAALAMGLLLVLARIPGLRWRAPAVLLLCVLPWLGAWQLRNRLQTGFSPFTSVVVLNLYFYQSAEVIARTEDRSFAEVQSQLGYANAEAYLLHHPEQAQWNQGERLRFMATEAGNVLRSHPGEYLRVQMVGSALVAGTPCAADLLRLLDTFPEDAPQRLVHEGTLPSALRMAKTHPWMMAWMAFLELYLLTLYLLAARGIFLGAAQFATLWLLLGVSLYFIAVSGGVQAVGRYRLPIMPIVCIFAAMSLSHPLNRFASRKGMEE